MKIILLSDLHITEQGFPIWDTDTLTHFNVAVEKIAHIKDIDAILVSGDIADKGSEWAYQYVHEKLEDLNIPCYYIPGNHDNADNFKHRFLSSNTIVGNSVVINDWNFILLDSTIPDPDNPSTNMSRGYLEEDKLSYLKREIELCKNKNRGSGVIPWQSYPKMIDKRYMKNGRSDTPCS